MLGKAPLTSRDVNHEADLVHVYHGVLQKYGLQRRPIRYGAHIVDGTARYTAGATRLRMSIQMSLASVVAHTMGFQLSGFAQLPFSYSGCTRFAQSGGTSVFPMAISDRRGAKWLFRFSGSLR